LLNRLGFDAASFREKDADDVQVLRSAPSQDDVVTELGYEQLKRHSLRHPGPTWMEDAGLPLHVLRKIAGHPHLSTTHRYLHPDRQPVAGAGELLSKHLWSQNGPSSGSSDSATKTSAQVRAYFLGRADRI
jgi:hypothetical protein